MFTYLFIWSLLCFSTNGNDSKGSFFDGSFKLAYHIVSTNEMEIKVLMPIKFKWLLAGFHNIPYLSSPQEDLFWLGVKKENNSVKPILQVNLFTYQFLIVLCFLCVFLKKFCNFAFLHCISSLYLLKLSNQKVKNSKLYK